MNHKSINENILWYVDYISNKTDENKYLIKGWILHNNEKIINITINNEDIFYKSTKRKDVKDYYNMYDEDLGFEILINEDDIQKPLEIITSYNLYVIESLEKFFIFYSGFKSDEKNLIIVDDFYNDPHLIRNYVINNLKFNESDYHKGKRTEKFIINGTKERLEQIIGKKIINWDNPSYANGVFQYCTAKDPIVYHVDMQQYAAVVFLTPDAPLETGTSTYKSKFTNEFRFENLEGEKYVETFKGNSTYLNFYDSTNFELVDRVANVFNRLVIWDAKTIHAANKYFGDEIHNSRFFQLFFFDLK